MYIICTDVEGKVDGRLSLGLLSLNAVCVFDGVSGGKCVQLLVLIVFCYFAISLQKYSNKEFPLTTQK